MIDTIKRKFDDLVNDYIIFLKEKLGYSEVMLKKYQGFISVIQNKLNEMNVDYYNRDVFEVVVNRLLGNDSYETVNRKIKDVIRCATTLLEFMISGTIAYRIKSNHKEFILSIDLQTLFDDYLNHRKEMGFSIKNHVIYLKNFLFYLTENNIDSIQDMTDENIIEYVKRISISLTPSGRHNSLSIIKIFFTYLYDEGILNKNYSYLVPKDNYKSQANLPTTYSTDEIDSILKVVDRANPKGKRDYAMLLLAIRYGLRASDIVGLKFEFIHWDRALIEFKQVKTNKLIQLHLSNEVGNAIFDYIKYARPKSNEPFVFLKVNPPYDKIVSPTLHSIVTLYMRKAGVNFEGKKHGPHSLRHSLGSELLRKETSIHVISEVLGHSNIESTKVYLRIDTSKLIECALEVPRLNNSFYTRKGDK